MARRDGALNELLLEHGVAERGARLYRSACQSGPSTVAELAHLAGLHRVEAYRFIRDLEAVGLLRPTGGRPMRFSALPLEQLVDRWIRRTSEKLDRFKGDKEKMLADWRETIATPELGDGRKFAVVEGRRTIQRFLRRRLEAAEKEILLSVGGFSLASAIDGGVDASLRSAHDRGVRVRLVTDVTGANLVEARHFGSFTELRHATSPVTNRAIVLDRTAALVFVSGEEGLGTSGEDQVALWTTAPSVLALAREYHHRLWSRGVPFERRRVAIENPSPAVLPVVQGKEQEPFQRLREITELGMRVTGLKELKFDLPEVIQTIAHQMGREVADAVVGRTPETVAQSLAEYYDRHAMGRLEVVRARPLTLKVTQCFACTPQWTEIGRVMCPKMLKTVLEQRLGEGWEVSEPDPRRHATKGCVFSVTPI